VRSHKPWETDTRGKKTRALSVSGSLLLQIAGKIKIFFYLVFVSSGTVSNAVLWIKRPF
jgi:uncharacterized protein (DUF924 family)